MKTPERMYLHDNYILNYYSIFCLENVEKMTPFELVVIGLMALGNIILSALFGIMVKFDTRLVKLELYLIEEKDCRKKHD